MKLFTSACEFALRKDFTGNIDTLNQRALTRLQKMSTLSLRGCALSPAAFTHNVYIYTACTYHTCTRSYADAHARGYMRTSEASPCWFLKWLSWIHFQTRYDMKYGGKRKEKVEKEEKNKEEEEEEKKHTAPCGVWQYEEADYPTRPEILRSRLVTRDSV